MSEHDSTPRTPDILLVEVHTRLNDLVRRIENMEELLYGNGQKGVRELMAISNERLGTLSESTISLRAEVQRERDERARERQARADAVQGWWQKGIPAWIALFFSIAALLLNAAALLRG